MTSKNSRPRGRQRGKGRSSQTKNRGRERPSGQQRDTWPRKVSKWLAGANKAVLASIGAGLLAIITAWVAGLPHQLDPIFHSSTPPLTAAGDDPAAGISCFGEDFLTPGVRGLPRTVSSGQLLALLQGGADPSTSGGTYTLQAKTGDTVIITSVHLIVLKRIPAKRATEVTVDPSCAGCCGPTANSYLLQIDLDNTHPTPTAFFENVRTQNETIVQLKDLRVIVTNQAPIIIDVDAETAKYDVTWKLRIDYNIDGQSRVMWIENGSKPFHTIAVLPADPDIHYAIDSNLTSWSQAPN
jgi:hypothetical protein